VIFPICASQVAGITDMSHHTWPHLGILLIKSLNLFFSFFFKLRCISTIWKVHLLFKFNYLAHYNDKLHDVTWFLQPPPYLTNKTNEYPELSLFHFWKTLSIQNEVNISRAKGDNTIETNKDLFSYLISAVSNYLNFRALFCSRWNIQPVF
jgi:hypothetical protein